MTKDRTVQRGGAGAVEVLFVSKPGGQSQQVFRGQSPDCCILSPTYPSHVIPQPGGERLKPGPELDSPRDVEIFPELEDLHEPGHVVAVAVVEASLSSVVLHHGGCRLTQR